MAHIQVTNLEVVDQMIDAAQFEQEKMRGGNGDRITYNPNGMSYVETGLATGPKDEFFYGPPNNSFGPYAYGSSSGGGYTITIAARIPIGQVGDFQFLTEVQY